MSFRLGLALKRSLRYIVPVTVFAIASTSPFLITRASSFMSSSSSSTSSTCVGSGDQAVSLNFDSIPLKLVRSESQPLGETIQSESLWKNENSGALIMVVRRPGWPLCREGALDLSQELYPKLPDPKPALIGIVAETTSLDPFITDYFKNGKVYLDEDRTFSKVLGSKKLGLGALFSPSMWKAVGRQRSKYPELEGDLKGEGRFLGGVVFIGKGDDGVLYSYKEKHFGDNPDLQEISDAIVSYTKGNKSN